MRQLCRVTSTTGRGVGLLIRTEYQPRQRDVADVVEGFGALALLAGTQVVGPLAPRMCAEDREVVAVPRVAVSYASRDHFQISRFDLDRCSLGSTESYASLAAHLAQRLVSVRVVVVVREDATDPGAAPTVLRE